MNNELNNNKSLRIKRNNQIEIVFLSDNNDNEEYISILFPIILNNNRHKYLNRYDFFLKESMIYPNNFRNIYYPEFIDKLKSIEILIISYNIQNKLSLEYLKTFYYLYYNKLEENDKPKNIIILEFDYCPNEKIINIGRNNIIKEPDDLVTLFNGIYCKYEYNEEEFKEILKKCLKKKEKDNLFNDYRKFKNVLLNEVIYFSISLFGNDDLQNYFIKLLLFESKCNFNYEKLSDGLYLLNYEKITDTKKIKFQIKIVKRDNYYKSEDISQINILLYSLKNENNSFTNIKHFVINFLSNHEEMTKELFFLFALNNNSDLIEDKENNKGIKNGKTLSDEIGAYFSVLNSNNKNIGEEIGVKFDKIIIEEIIKCIEKSKKKISKMLNKNINLNKNFDFLILKNYNSPYIYVEEINNRIKNSLDGNNNFLLNLCENCYDNLNIRINNSSNIIIIYCNKCKLEPKGLKIEQFLQKKNEKIYKFICGQCLKIKDYDFKTKKIYHNCEPPVNITKSFKGQIKTIFKKNETEQKEQNKGIPLFLKDAYCVSHNKFHSYYLKYSKKGLCEDCYKEKKNNYFVENFNEKYINDLINIKKNELKIELDFIKSLQNKVNDCLKTLQEKFDKLIANKIKLNNIKLELINTLQIIKNNYTIYDNVNSLEFDSGEKFKYNIFDTVENRLKYLYNYLNCESDIDNIFYKKSSEKGKIICDGPYTNFTEKDKAITDVLGICNNKLICISFDNGKAEIYDLNINKKNSYPICIIEEFSPYLGINSLYLSKNENNFWNSNKNDILYLNGWEQIKIIQMNDDYKSYKLLYIINEEKSNIYLSTEIRNNLIMILNNNYKIKLIYLNKENNEIKNEIKDITEQLIESNKSPTHFNKISKNIISLDISLVNEFPPLIIEDGKRITLSEELFRPTQDIKRKDSITRNSLFSINSRISKEDPSTRASSTINENEKYTKIIYLNTDNIQVENNNFIKKEYIFDKGYEVFGCLSKDENLLLVNYINDKNSKDCIIYIFDFNFFQFIYSFKFNSLSTLPKLFLKTECEYSLDKIEFILCDNELNIFQYFYDKNYSNQIYYLNKAIAEKKEQSTALKIINLDKKIMIVCENNRYYLL